MSFFQPKITNCLKKGKNAFFHSLFQLVHFNTRILKDYVRLSPGLENLA